MAVLIEQTPVIVHTGIPVYQIRLMGHIRLCGEKYNFLI